MFKAPLHSAAFSKQSLQCKGIFNWEGLDPWKGPEAARLDVVIFFLPDLKAGCWFSLRKQLCLMHWHSQVVWSVVLALIYAGTLILTQTHRFVCVACEERAAAAPAAHLQLPTLR